MCLGPKFKKLIVTESQKIRGTPVHLKPGVEVFEVTPEEDGWIAVKTKNGEEGGIPISSIRKNLCTYMSTNY